MLKTWLVGTLAALFSVSALAQTTLDQDHAGNGGAQPMMPSEVWAQTFAPGITGALTQVNLNITTEPDLCLISPIFCGVPRVPGDLTISIRDTVAGIANVPNGRDYSNTACRMIPSDTDLAIVTVSAPTVPEGFPGGGSGLNITFPTPVTVVTGHVYAIVVQSGGTARHEWAIAQTTNVDSYPSGTMFFNSGSAWYDYGDHATHELPEFQKFYIDAQFQTFVDKSAVVSPNPPSNNGGCLPAPSNLSATQSGAQGTAINLTWDYGSNPIDGFSIYRKAAADTQWPSTPAITVPPASRSFSDVVPVAFDTYSYRVTAYEAGDESSASQVATAFQIKLETLTNNHQILATFAPGVALQQAASDFGFDHFNWISHVTAASPCVGLPSPPPPPVLDPPFGGWSYAAGDVLPYYWNELQGFDARFYLLSSLITGSNFLKFNDIPITGCVFPQLGNEQFETVLVGINLPVGSQLPPNFKVLAAFFWGTNFTGFGGGITGFRTYNLDLPLDDGGGGIFNIEIVNSNDLPLGVRTALTNLGAEGLSTNVGIDRTAPLTTALLSGLQGNAPWYQGPVMVTLVATDVDGPSDVSTTSYTVDGGSSELYMVPFTITGDGNHTVQFGSRDQVGNVESTRTTTFGIDQTPPVIVTHVAGTLGTNGWYVGPVSVSWGVTDSESGVASSSGCNTINLVADGQTSLNCSATNGAGLVSSVPLLVRIDQTPPTCVTASPSAATLWPIDKTLVPVSILGIADPQSDVSVTIDSVMSDERTTVTPADSAWPDAVIHPAGSVDLRRDRGIAATSPGNGRVYIVHFTAMNAAGLACTGSVNVNVPRTLSTPVVVDSPLYDATTKN